MKNQFSPLDLGIIVAGLTDVLTWELLADSFAMSASLGNQPLSLDVKWQNPPSGLDALHSFVVRHFQALVIQKPYTLHLISFPEAWRKDFDLDAIEFPFKIAGMVLVIDLSESDLDVQLLEGAKLLNWGGIRWIKSAHIPYVIIAVGFDKPKISIAELYKICGLPPESSIFHYTPNYPPSFNFFHMLDYDYEFTQAVLANLIEQIELTILSKGRD